MEEEKVMEQPSPDSVNVNEQIIDSKGQSISEGSMFGKFKDATSLLSAYNNLEKEFTRKSQLLSELSKEIDSLKTQNQTSNTEKSGIELQNKAENIDSEENLQQQIKPQYCNKNWRRRVGDFLVKNPSARGYTTEISNILLNDKNLSSLDNCLEYAFSIAKSQNPKPAELNEQTINTFALDKRLKDKIIKEFLLGVKENKSGLSLISGEATNVTVSPNNDKPKTLKDASNILKKLLQS